MAAAEIGFDHSLFAHHFLRPAAGNDMALVEHEHTLGQRHNDFHDVLNDDDGDPHLVNAPHQRDGLVQFGRRQAGERFIQQQETRLRRQHARDLETLASRRTERPRRLFRMKAGQFDDAKRLFARIVAMRMAQERANHHIMQDAHVLERGRHLKSSPDAGTRAGFGRGARDIRAAEHDRARSRHGLASKTIEEGRFSGAVGADQPDDLAFVHRQIGARDGAEFAEHLRDVSGLKQHGRAFANTASCDATDRPSRPARSARSGR
jgi:hypothetical protein